MKRIIIIISTITLLLAISTVRNAQAEEETMAKTPAPPLSNNLGEPLNWLNQEGSDELQSKVLMQINEGLVKGWLSAAEASHFKSQLNKINDQESWYQSFRKPIPASLTNKNIALLKEMSQKLQPKHVPSASVGNALHADIDDLIGKALAKNHITSDQAETYYLRLAQIESNLDSIKESPASDEKTTINQSLSQLKAELICKAD